MTILQQLRNVYDDDWSITKSGGKYRAKWKGSVEKLVDIAIHAFGDYEECVEIDTEKLITLAKEEIAEISMQWDMQNEDYTFTVEELKDEELRDYLLARLSLWAKMGLEEISVV